MHIICKIIHANNTASHKHGVTSNYGNIRHRVTQAQEIVGALTLRRLMSYICMEHPFLMFLGHTQRRSTVGRTPLDE